MISLDSISVESSSDQQESKFWKFFVATKHIEVSGLIGRRRRKKME
jgi:hypothetical protein